MQSFSVYSHCNQRTRTKFSLLLPNAFSHHPSLPLTSILLKSPFLTLPSPFDLAQAALELVFLLPQLLKAGITGKHHHIWSTEDFFFFFLNVEEQWVPLMFSDQACCSMQCLGQCARGHLTSTMCIHDYFRAQVKSQLRTCESRVES